MKRFLAAALLLLVVTVSPAARGDDDGSKTLAAKRFAEGLHAYDVAEFKHDPKMYEVAYQSFLQAYALSPTDKVLWPLALSEVDTGRYLPGMGHLRLYDAHQHVIEQPSHGKFKLMQEYMARASSATGHATIGAPAGTPLSLDGKAIGAAPLPMQDLEPGPHVAEGLGQRLEFKVGAGDTVTVTLTAPPPPAPPFAPPAPMREMPPTPPAPPPASHGVRDAVRWSSSGLAVAAVGVGVGFMVDANSRASDVNAFRSSHPSGCASMQSAACTQTQSMESSYHQSVTLSQAFLVVGAVSAVGAVASWTLWPSGEMRLSPQAGDHQAGLMLFGSF
jgi:hypothetical protein